MVINEPMVVLSGTKSTGGKSITVVSPVGFDLIGLRDTQEHVGFLTEDDNCGEAFHSDTTAYGQNVFLCGQTSGYGCYSANMAMEEFCEYGT